MRKIANFFISFLLIFSISTAYAKATSLPPVVEGEGVALIDATTGTLIYGKNEHEVLAPASTTKIMTALLVLENKSLDEKVTIGKNPPFAEGTSIGLKEGEIFSINDLLHGLLLESANDCAVALAEAVAGSEKDFAKLMNAKAKTLGALDTNFINASGLYEEGHVTTAYDLSLIMKAVTSNETFTKISRKPLYQFPPSNIDGSTRWVNNKNELILNNSHFYKYALCGKTGYTTLSKHTYTAEAEKDGHVLILSIIKSDSKQNYFPDAKKLFDYGFDNFSLVKLYSKGSEVSSYKIDDKTTAPLLATKDVYYLIKNSDFSDSKTVEDKIKKLAPSIILESKDLSKTSFKSGEEILSGFVSVNDKQITNISLASSIDRTYTPPSKLSSLKNVNFFIVGSCLLAVIILITLFKFRSYKKKIKNNDIYEKTSYNNE